MLENYNLYGYHPNFEAKPQNPQKQEKPQIEEPVEEKSLEELDEEYYRSLGLIPENNSKAKKIARNALLASLMGLSTLNFAVAGMMDDDICTSSDYTKPKIEVVDENVTELMNNAKQNDSIVGLTDIYGKLDKTLLGILPQSEQDAINTVVKANISPIKLRGVNDKTRVSEELRIAQHVLDKAVERTIKAPKVDPYQQMNHYEYEYITGSSLCRDVDFSGVLKYQKDISVLKALLSKDMAKIKRFEPGAIKKYLAEVEKAQRTVDQIAKNYEIRSCAVGNTDGDRTLTRRELQNALYQENLDDIPADVKQQLLDDVVPQFFSYDLSNINTVADAKRVNKQGIGPILQKTQNQFDAKVDSVRMEQFKKAHPDVEV